MFHSKFWVCFSVILFPVLVTKAYAIEEYRLYYDEVKSIAQTIERTLIMDDDWSTVHNNPRFDSEWIPLRIIVDDYPDFIWKPGFSPRLNILDVEWTNFSDRNQAVNNVELDKWGNFFYPSWLEEYQFMGCLVDRRVLTDDHRFCTVDKYKDCAVCRIVDYTDSSLNELWTDTKGFRDCRDSYPFRANNDCINMAKQDHFQEYVENMTIVWRGGILAPLFKRKHQEAFRNQGFFGNP